MSCTPKLDGSCSCDSGNGSAESLQDAYDNSVSPPIVLSNTPGSLLVRDASVPLAGNLLAVQNNAGSTDYLAVSSAGVQIDGKLTVSGLIDPTGLVLTSQAGSPINNSLWVRTGSPTELHYTDDTGTDNQITPVSGGMATLQTAYSASSAPPIILSTSPGSFVIRDSATPLIGSLLAVQDNTGLINYLSVGSTSTLVTGRMRTSVGYQADTRTTAPAVNTIWIRSGGSNTLWFTDGTGASTQITGLLTTKGDLLGFSTALTRLPVGSSGTFLRADPVAATGLSWQSASSSSLLCGGGGVAATTNSSSYTNAFTVAYLGSAISGTISNVVASAYRQMGTGTYNLRLFDETNSLVIAETTGHNNTTVGVIDLGVISNVPSTGAILRLQFNTSSIGTRVAAFSVTIQLAPLVV